MSKTILVVDDSSALREVLSIVFKEAGYNVIEASDGKEALDKLNGQKIHLIICDVYMPNMDGITFLIEAKKMDEYKFTPIVMLTNEGGEDKKLTGQAGGAKAWVVKPFQPVQILTLVSKLIL